MQRVTVNGLTYTVAHGTVTGPGGTIPEERIRTQVLNLAARRRRAAAQAKAKHDALTSLGLVRVRGARGGVYYE